MTDQTICQSNIENTVSNFPTELSLPVPLSPNASATATTPLGSRPTAIPRLASATQTRPSHAVNSNGKNAKSKIPLSPLNIKSPRPKSVGSYIKSPMQEPENCRDFLTSPTTYCKRSSRDVANVLHNSLNVDVRMRTNTKSLNRHERAISEENSGRKTSMESSFSEKTNYSGNTNNSNYVITSKIGSLANSKHRPGGGNVKIFEEKIDFSNIESKCGSKKNIKHKPGGGTVEIRTEKLNFNKKAQSKVNSLKNIEHQPSGGDVKIDNLKLEWNVSSKVGSLANVKHKASGGHVQIINEPLPWLKYNKPNLPPEEIAKINKRSGREEMKEGSQAASRSCSNSFCSDRSN